MYPSTYSLIHAAAATEKPAINVVFSTPTQRVTKQYTFFPSIYLPHTSTNVFETLLQQPSFPRHQFVTHPHSVQVLARDFTELKKIAFALFAQTQYLPMLIEPERQFLLAQKWKYFQSFDKNFNPLPGAFGDTQIPGFVEPLYPTLKHMHAHPSKLQAEWYEKISAAHELLHPITEKILTAGEKIEMHLDNALFQLQMPLPMQSTPPADTSNWSVEARERAKKQILLSPIHAEGNCTCCKPKTFNEIHVLSQSFVNATTTHDGIYIHTQDQTISETFHEQHSGKEKRVARANEYGLQLLPIGPLARHQRIQLPLNEAIDEMHQGNVKIEFDSGTAKWRCKHKPFALGLIHAQLHERMQAHAQNQNALLQPYMNQFQLYYTQFAQQDPGVQLHAHAEKLTRQLYENMAWHLIRGETKWR